MRRIYCLGLSLILSVSAFWGQTGKDEMFANPNKTAGVHYAYPANEIKQQTLPPKGYEPFYISHFGRHGSRYLISDNEYKWIIDLFEKAKKENALSPLGEDVLNRLQLVWQEAEGSGGDLSRLGVREQRGIAERMYQNYPEVFTDDADLFACATTIVRCVLSMDAFSERLKELNPNMQITREAGLKHQAYLNHHTKEAIDFRSADDTWREEYLKFEKTHVNPDRLISSLFTNKEFIKKKVNPEKLMWGLFAVAGGMQNIETEADFYDIFEAQELFDLWQCKNYRLYVNDANSSQNNGLMFENCKPVLRRMISSADSIIVNNKNGADFKFAHDGNIIPLALLLHLDDCYNSVDDPDEFYKAWSDFKVAPMAGNIQLVFYRNSKDPNDILVKFLLHENEILVPPIKTDSAPYYKWSDVKSYYQSLLEK